MKDECSQFRTLAIEKVKNKLNYFDDITGDKGQILAEKAVDDWLGIMNEIGYEPQVKDMEE
jgi:hypothetical protein